MPHVGDQDVFERVYTSKFKALLAPYGQFVDYESDRAALDLGLHLYGRRADAGGQLGQVRVWFQLKGIRSTTLDAGELATANHVSLAKLRIDQVRYWYAHPEPVYLAVYLESQDRFLAQDVRDLVDRAGGLPWLAEAQASRATVTLHVDCSATLQTALERMPHHRSLRLDGPEFRGRPLGHRLDPLRSELNALDAADFDELVGRLLSAHDFRTSREVDISSMLDSEIGTITAMVGRLYLTYEWTTPLETEFGYGPDTDFRIEARPNWAHGPVMVVIHSEVLGAPQPNDATRHLVDRLKAEGISRALVFFNASDLADPHLIGGWRTALEPLVQVPQGLASLAFNVLTATSVYLEFLDRLTWRFVNVR